MWIRLALALVLGLLAGDARAAKRELLLATTTSVQDTGLLDALLPEFTKDSGIAVRVVAVGSGAALRMGADGNADLVLAHAPGAEAELLRSGAVRARYELMENYFVIAGPAGDPARVREAKSGAEALQRIAQAKAAYVSRGDDSGTHKKEQELLGKAGIDPKAGWTGFASTGAGMGQTLMVAGERRAYVLSDLGTFLAFRERATLERLTADAPDLRNVYSLLPVDPARFAGKIHAAEADALVEWLRKPETLRAIGEFGRAKAGQALFRPLP